MRIIIIFRTANSLLYLNSISPLARISIYWIVSNGKLILTRLEDRRVYNENVDEDVCAINIST